MIDESTPTNSTPESILNQSHEYILCGHNKEGTQIVPLAIAGIGNSLSLNIDGGKTVVLSRDMSITLIDRISDLLRRSLWLKK